MKTEDQDHSPPGHGALIRLAREAKGWSPETAAAHMPFRFSGSSWRNIEAGYRGAGAKRIAVPGKAGTVAAMARTVGVTADRLQEHHREAAEILREMERQDAQQAPQLPEPLSKLSEKDRTIILAALEDVDPEDRPAELRKLADTVEAMQRRRERAARKPGESQRPRHAG